MSRWEVHKIYRERFTTEVRALSAQYYPRACSTRDAWGAEIDPLQALVSHSAWKHQVNVVISLCWA